MKLVKQPTFADYWTTHSTLFGVQFLQNLMPREKFQRINANLHFDVYKLINSVNASFDVVLTIFVIDMSIVIAYNCSYFHQYSLCRCSTTVTMTLYWYLMKLFLNVWENAHFQFLLNTNQTQMGYCVTN